VECSPGHGEARVETTGITRIDADANLRAGATIRGLTSGGRSSFPLRVVTPAGRGERAAAVSRLVP